MTPMSMSGADRIRHHADQLYHALRRRQVVEPLSLRDPTLTLDDAYAISLDLLGRRLHSGERVIGKKIGVTSAPVQKMLQVDQPDFGFLTDTMRVANGAELAIEGRLIQPRAEAEIALIMGKRLCGPGVTAADVLAATAAVVPCFEVVDSRIRDWKIGIVDTVADNASCGAFVLGEDRLDPRGFDLESCLCTMYKNGAPLSQGYGRAAMGSPLISVAWLANTLGARGVALEAADIVLSGALVPLEPAAAGDVFEMRLQGVGEACVRFV